MYKETHRPIQAMVSDAARLRTPGMSVGVLAAYDWNSGYDWARYASLFGQTKRVRYQRLAGARLVAQSVPVAKPQPVYVNRSPK